jgi:hypothetical protein
MSIKSVKKNYVCIQGPPLNWAWSLKELGAERIGPSASGENPPDKLSEKRRDQILWAFGDSDIYERLKKIVNESSYVRAILVTTKEGFPNMQGGIIGFGEIHKDDLIGELKWDYWPLRTGWDYKFFIRVVRLGPKIANSLNKLKNWHLLSRDRIKQVVPIISEWNESILSIVPKNLTQASMITIDEKTYGYLSFIASHKWMFEKTQKSSEEI